MLKTYPWKELEKGQGFFVPALDLDVVQEAGLLAAVQVRVLDARAMPCLFRGMFGVLFYRKPLTIKKPVENAPSSSHTSADTTQPTFPSEHPEP